MSATSSLFIRTMIVRLLIRSAIMPAGSENTIIGTMKTSNAIVPIC
jgi:hypothetical protein